MDDAQARAARRAFVLAHHPDRGGDPDVFASGLAALSAGGHADRPARVVVVRRRSLPRRVVATVRRRLDPPPRRVR